MEKKKVVPTWLSVVLLALLVIGIGYFIYEMVVMIPIVGFNALAILYIIGIIKYVFAIIYCVMGYKKNAAGIFKVYCFIMTLSQIIAIYSVSSGLSVEEVKVIASVTFFLDIIACGNWFVLTLAKDLGKKTTTWLCGINIICSVIIVFLNITYGWYFILAGIFFVIGSVIAGIMFYCKYADKEARGAK